MSAMLEGKTVIVTGAGGGLGRDFALAMAAAGASVVVNDIGAELDGSGGSQAPAAKVVAEIEGAGGRAIANNDSVAGEQSARSLVQSAVDAFGRLDAVVNNAGIVRDRMFFNMSTDEWKAVLDVHLNGSFHVSRAAAELFRAQSSGSFVHITSTSGLIGGIGQANYAAAKMGIVGLSRSISLDMARYGVRSNCIAPFAWSRMTDSIPTDTDAQRARVAALKRMRGELVAPLAVYLAGDRASEVSGQVFTVRANEIFLMSQPRPLRGMHAADGWTAESIADHVVPALAPHFYGPDRTADVFSWDPV